MTWPHDQLSRIAGSEELQITSTRNDGTRRGWTTIWVVRVGDDLFLRAAGGTGSAWYRHATEHDSAHVRAGGVEADVAVQHVSDPGLIDQVTAAYQTKYRAQPGLVALFLKPPATQATLRIDSPA